MYNVKGKKDYVYDLDLSKTSGDTEIYNILWAIPLRSLVPLP